MSKTNIGCETCGVIGPHVHSWVAELGTLPRVDVKVIGTLVPAPKEATEK